LDATIENVAVTGGLETSNLNFVLEVSGAISGKVTDTISSLPLEGVIVEVNNATGSGISESAFTDANGDYLVNTNLATGTYNVTALSTGHIMKTVGGIAVTVGIETKNIDLNLGKSGTIFGTVTDSVSSAPLASIGIWASTAGGMFGGFAVTNTSGQYSINTNLATGTYNVSALFPESHVSKMISGIVVIAGAETAANLALDPSGIISGRLEVQVANLLQEQVLVHFQEILPTLVLLRLMRLVITGCQADWERKHTLSWHLSNQRSI
jgi:hypothetical protein